MARGRTFVLGGPWKGIEERETVQGDNHCQVALNVDFSRGYIESRKGFEAINTSTDGGILRNMHVVYSEGRPAYLITVGTLGAAASYGDIAFKAFRLDGTQLAAGYPITTRLGEPADTDVNVSFVDTVIAVEKADGTSHAPRPVTLIVTRYNTYVYDPLESELVIRKADMTKDTIRLNNTNFGYWDESPGCEVAINHKGYTCYANFRNGYEAPLSLNVEALQNLIPENLVDQNTRGKLHLGPSNLVLSDPEDALGIIEYRAFSVDKGERITGLYSFMEQLIVFTDKSIYSMTGSTDTDFAMFKVVDGIGCIGKDTIVEVGSALYFMSHDGFYAFQGMGPEGGAIKLSKGIDSLFTGEKVGARVPEGTIATALNKIRWPFRLKLDSCRRSHAVHFQSKNQIWWSLRCTNDNADTGEYFSIIAVFDYVAQAWSYHYPTKMHAVGEPPASLMYSGVTYKLHGREQMVTSARWNDTDGDYLFRYGGITDGPSSDTTAIACIYQTGRLFKQNASVATYRPVRLSMLSTTKSSHFSWSLEGEEAHADAQYVDAAGAVQSTAAEDRQLKTGTESIHPETGGSAFWGTGTWTGGVGTRPFTWTDRDWFTKKIEADSIKSRSLRLLLDQRNVNPGAMVIQSIIVEVEGGDTR